MEAYSGAATPPPHTVLWHQRQSYMGPPAPALLMGRLLRGQSRCSLGSSRHIFLVT